jgi:hypothetical protein
MTTLTMHEIQHNYRERKHKTGWKRIQIWKLDETNRQVRERIQIGAKIANQSQDDIKLVDEISAYTHASLQDIPL